MIETKTYEDLNSGFNIVKLLVMMFLFENTLYLFGGKHGGRKWGQGSVTLMPRVTPYIS